MYGLLYKINLVFDKISGRGPNVILSFLSFLLTFSLSFFLSLSIYYSPSPNLGLTPPGTKTQMPVCQMPVEGATNNRPEYQTDFTRAGLLICGQQNVRASTRDNTRQNTDKGHTSSPRIQIKIPAPAGNRTQAAARGWKAVSLPTTPWRLTVT